MKIGQKFGLLLLVGAFVFAAAGNAARGLSGEPGIFGILGAAKVLEILAPNFMLSLAVLFQNYLHPLFWDPLFIGLLAFPGWLLLGLPGVILIWKYRQIPLGGEATKEELAYNTYEDVLAAAKEAELENPNELSRYEHLQDYDPLCPPDDGVKYDGVSDLPSEASDLADFRNDLGVLPIDLESLSGTGNENYIQTDGFKNLRTSLPDSDSELDKSSESTPEGDSNYRDH